MTVGGAASPSGKIMRTPSLAPDELSVPVLIVLTGDATICILVQFLS